MSDIKILNFPYPFKAWLTISNDPDNTTIERWRELNMLIFDDLALPWANAVFPLSYNTQLQDQVNLKSNPEIAYQATDAIHTWGDFVLAGGKGFSREDAYEAMSLLRQAGISPLVWVDHSRFSGNMLHRSNWGSTPSQVDASGLVYRVPEYTLDLVDEIGIRYMWDGSLTALVGQDRKLKTIEKIRSGYRSLSALWQALKNIVVKSDGFENRVYSKRLFPDGSSFYVFNRYGSWRDADIEGLSNILSDTFLNKLVQNKGVSIVYTHLGKSRKGHGNTKPHVPKETRQTLLKVRELYLNGSINFSSVSKLLDYLVIRDNIEVRDNEINFKSDGIRFRPLAPNDLKFHKFSFRCKLEVADLKVSIDGKRIPCVWQAEGHGIFSLSGL